MSDIELVRIGFCVGDEFPEIAGGKILADRQHFREFGGEADRRKILLRVVAEIRIERRRQRIGAEVAGDEGIAVRRRLRGASGTGCPSGADDILDQEFLAEMPRENIGNDPARDVGWAAGSKRHDDGHRPGRIVLGPGGPDRGCDHQRKNRRS